MTGWIYNPTDDKWRELGFNDLDEVEQLKATAQTMMDVFNNALVFIAVHRSVWPDANVTNAREGIYWMSVNSARIALGTRTAARRGKFMEEAASWPDGVNGDVGQYVDAMGGPLRFRRRTGAGLQPEMDPYTRVTVSQFRGDIWFRHQCCERAIEREVDRKGLDKRHSVAWRNPMAST